MSQVRVRTPQETPFPCVALLGGPPGPDELLMAVEQGTPLTDLCPYGTLAYQFPQHPEALAVAEALAGRQDGESWFLRPAHGATDVSGRPQDAWVPCGGPDFIDARPNLEKLRKAGFLDEGYECPCFEHDCPVYYGVDPE